MVKHDRPVPRGPGGSAVLDPDAALADVVAVIDECLSHHDPAAGHIETIASCAFWHSLVGIDARGKPTTPVLTWADTQSREYSALLKKRFDEHAVHTRTGAHFHSSYWPAKLLWLRNTLPDVWRRTSRWLSFSDYVALRLAGDAGTSVSMAAGTGIFDQHRSAWDRQLARYLRVSIDALPRLAADGESFSLRPKLAARWAPLAHARWLPAVGDGAADTIGSGCTSPHQAVLMIGTSGAMRIILEGGPPESLPDGLWCYRLDRHRVVVGGALSDGGNLYKWLSDTLRVPRGSADLMRQRGAAAHGLVVLPFFHGERSTGYDENARGAVIGLTPAHDAVDILQAGMEAVAYRFAEIYDRLAFFHAISEIVASGGALRASPVWTQILADVLGRDLTHSNRGESSLYGTVLLALPSTGKIENIDSTGPVSRGTIKYHPECHAIYTEARKMSLREIERIRIT